MTPVVGGLLGVVLGVVGGIGLTWTVRRYVRPGVPGRSMRYAVATLARWAALALGLAVLLKHGGGQKAWIVGGFGVGYVAAVGAGMRRSRTLYDVPGDGPGLVRRRGDLQVARRSDDVSGT